MKPPKKLSTTMRRGYKIMKERGLRQCREDFFKIRDGEIVAACALGAAQIGIHGWRETNRVEVSGFGLPDIPGLSDLPVDVEDWNDTEKLRIPTIIKRLEEQGL